MPVLRLALIALALVALSTPAWAQTTAAPIKGDYDDVYVIAGRALDSRGRPVSGGTLIVELEQEGVKAEPLPARANCKGDFITSFTLREVDPAGKAKITLLAPPGGQNVTTTVGLDPFYRRSDAILRLDTPWQAECAREQYVWPVSASLSARLLNRTEPYNEDGYDFHATPYTGVIRLRYETPGGNTVCPPHPQDTTPGACETFLVDERGDLRYTFTLDQPFDAGGVIEIILQEGESLRVPIDPSTRMGVKYFEITGQGVPQELYKTPFAPVWILLLAAAMAFSLRRG